MLIIFCLTNVLHFFNKTSPCDGCDLLCLIHIQLTFCYEGIHLKATQCTVYSILETLLIIYQSYKRYSPTVLFAQPQKHGAGNSTTVINHQALIFVLQAEKPCYSHMSLCAFSPLCTAFMQSLIPVLLYYSLPCHCLSNRMPLTKTNNRLFKSDVFM